MDDPHVVAIGHRLFFEKWSMLHVSWGFVVFSENAPTTGRFKMNSKISRPKNCQKKQKNRNFSRIFSNP